MFKILNKNNHNKINDIINDKKKLIQNVDYRQHGNKIKLDGIFFRLVIWLYHIK